MTAFLAFATGPKAPLPGQLAWMAAACRGRHGRPPTAAHARGELAARLDTGLRVAVDDRVPAGSISVLVSADNVEAGGPA